MYIRFFSISVLICVSPGTNIDAAPTHSSRVREELTPLPIHGVRGSSTATDIVRALESERRTSCLNKLIGNLTKQGKKVINRRFKKKLKNCDNRWFCWLKAAASKKKQLRNIKIDYAVVRGRCVGACFESGELKEAFDLYTRGSVDEQRQMQVLHGKIANWPTCSATHLDDLFEDDRSVEDMWQIFTGSNEFNGDISTWDTSSVTSMYRTFYDSKVFNGDISAWDTSSVTWMDTTFADTAAFDSDLSAWDVSSVVSMVRTFWHSHKFNGNISTWDTSSVKDMSGTFSNTAAFNINLSSWDISNVSDASAMFNYAAVFTQCLEWSFKPGTDTDRMFWGNTGRISDKC